MKIILLIVGIPLVVVILIFMVFMLRIIFWGQITDFEVKFSIEKAPLLQGTTITEISKDEDPLPRQKPSTGDFPGGQEMLLSEDGTITDEKRLYDNDPRIEINVLWGQPGQPSLAFKGNEVFNVNDSKAGSRIGEFTNPALSIVRHVSPVNERYLLVVGDPAGASYSDSRLWQVDRSTLFKTEIAQKIYFTFDRPSMVFNPSGFNGIVVVYYTEVFSYDFEGVANVPKFSFIRIYNSDFPDGTDIAKFGYKAGIIVNVQWENESLILTGDPSRPSRTGKPRLPARVWQIQLPKRNRY